MSRNWLEKVAHVATAAGIVIATITYVSQVQGQRIDRSLELYRLYYEAGLSDSVLLLTRAYDVDKVVMHSPRHEDTRRESLLKLVDGNAALEESLKAIDSFFYAVKICISNNRCDSDLSAQMLVDPANEVFCRYFPMFEEFGRRHGPENLGESIALFATDEWPCS